MSKEDKAALDKGAKELQKAKAAAKPKKAKPAKVENPPEPIDLLSKTWHPSKRPITEILADHVKMAKGDVGVIVGDKTPLDEMVPILDYFSGMERNVGFFIGDVIIAGEEQHGAKFEAALAVTGRALSTLRGYVTTARAVPIEMRQKALSFTSHREVARLKSPEKKIRILEDAAKKTEAGKPPTTKEIRNAVVKAEPPTKSKTSGKSTSGKKKPAKKTEAPPPYEYTAIERLEFEDLLATLGDLDERLGSKSGKDFLASTVKVDNKLKLQLIAVTANIKSFIFALEKYTGY